MDMRPALVLVVVILGLTFGFASWWTPFGWSAIGPRLALPWGLPLVLLALVAYGDALRPLSTGLARIPVAAARRVRHRAHVHASEHRHDVAAKRDRRILPTAESPLRCTMARRRREVEPLSARADVV